MPITVSNPKSGKSIKPGVAKNNNYSTEFNPEIAGRALVSALEYLKNRLDWSGSKIANILHIPANTFNNWLNEKRIPLHSTRLSLEAQAIIHLLAIHKSLEAMFENPAHQKLWLSTFHPDLNNIPEKLMGESFDGLIFVRRYLENARGRGA